jgi:hypothetical protein
MRLVHSLRIPIDAHELIVALGPLQTQRPGRAGRLQQFLIIVQSGIPISEDKRFPFGKLMIFDPLVWPQYIPAPNL